MVLDHSDDERMWPGWTLPAEEELALEQRAAERRALQGRASGQPLLDGVFTTVGRPGPSARGRIVTFQQHAEVQPAER